MNLKLKNNSKLSFPYYTEIEYLESTGTQYIDTGVKISPTMGVFVDFQYSSLVNDHQALFGYIDSRSSGKYFCFYKDSAANHYMINCTPNSGIDTGVVADLDRHTLKFNITNKVIQIDDGNTYQTTLGSAPTRTADRTCPIFGRLYIDAQNASWEIGAFIRIYKFQIYNNGTLYKNFIPVLDNNGVPCMYETLSNTFFYNAGTGDFIVSSNIFTNVTTAYIENCPNISGMLILRGCTNLTNVRCDIGNVSGTLAEVQHYATLHGFNNHEEPDNTVPAIINGTFTITDWYTTSELQALQGTITGLTIVVDSSKNIDDLFGNDEIAVQTIDSTKVNYNPAVGILLYNSRYGTKAVVGWFMTKTEAAAINLNASIFDNKVNVVDSKAIVSDDNTISYSFSSFKEFKYFTAVTTLVNFKNCSNLAYIDIPTSVVQMELNTSALINCTSLIDLDLKNIVVQGTRKPATCGNWTGTLKVKKIYYTAGSRDCLNLHTQHFNEIDIDIYISTDYIFGNPVTKTCRILRINSLNEGTAYTNVLFWRNGDTGLKFIEVNSVIANPLFNTSYNNTSINEDWSFHLGKKLEQGDTLACTLDKIQGRNNMSINKCTNIYVGEGVDKTEDQTTLAQYTADSSWSTYASKFSCWYDYNGVYRTYRVIESMTNCTNYNTVTFPYITRGDAYSTVIIADEGYTIDSVTVTMYEAVDDGVTPNTPTDKTSEVYDPITGEINIPSVTGNVIITAVAS